MDEMPKTDHALSAAWPSPDSVLGLPPGPHASTTHVCCCLRCVYKILVRSFLINSKSLRSFCRRKTSAGSNTSMSGTYSGALGRYTRRMGTIGLLDTKKQQDSCRVDVQCLLLTYRRYQLFDRLISSSCHVIGL